MLLPGQGASRLRPFLRRACRIALPECVRIRARKPCVRLRLRLLGWNVRFIVPPGAPLGRAVKCRGAKYPALPVQSTACLRPPHCYIGVISTESTETSGVASLARGALKLVVSS